MRQYLLMIWLLLLSVPAHAQQKFLDVQEVISTGGITAWLVEDHSLPLISLRFSFQDAGSVHDPAHKQGQTQLLSNTLDEGAGPLDSQAFQKTLSDNSITLRFSASRDHFGGNLKTLTRTKAEAFNLLKLSLTQARFDNEPVERMRQANITRIKSSLSNPDWKAARLMNDRAYDGHPYAQNSGGTLSTLGKVTSSDLRNIVKKRLGRDRLFIAVTGDITAEELSTVIDGVFGTLPYDTPLSDIKKMAPKNSGSITLYKEDIPQTIIEIALPAFGREDDDFYALQVMNYIFGGAGFGSMLMEEAREKRGLTYGIYSRINDMRFIDSLIISTSTKNEAVSEMMDIIRKEMTKMKTQAISEEQLQDAKSYLTGSMPLSLSSTDKISGMILSLQLQELPIDYLDEYAKKINAVTIKDIRRVAARVLNEKNMTTVMVGNPENIEPSEIVELLPNVE